MWSIGAVFPLVILNENRAVHGDLVRGAKSYFRTATLCGWPTFQLVWKTEDYWHSNLQLRGRNGMLLATKCYLFQYPIVQTNMTRAVFQTRQEKERILKIINIISSSHRQTRREKPAMACPLDATQFLLLTSQLEGTLVRHDQLRLRLVISMFFYCVWFIHRNSR